MKRTGIREMALLATLALSASLAACSNPDGGDDGQSYGAAPAGVYYGAGYYDGDYYYDRHGRKHWRHSHDWNDDDPEGIREGRERRDPPRRQARQNTRGEDEERQSAPVVAPEPPATIRQQENLRSGGSAVGGGNAMPPPFERGGGQRIGR